MTQEYHASESCKTAERMPRRRDDLTIHCVDGDALVFDAVTANTHHFNETALAIWEACEPNQMVEEVVTRMIDTFDVHSEDAQAHVERVLKELKDLQLVIDK